MKEGNTNSEIPVKINESEAARQEKNSAKKERFMEAALPVCQQLFEKFAPRYVWESKDREQLVMLLQKICITKPELKMESELAESFYSFLQKLPEYWRTKKFTTAHLNANYNEIVSEIRAKQKSLPKQPVFRPIARQQPEVKKEPTEAEKKQIRESFIKSLCECYEKFVATGEHGLLPLWVMYDTLTEEKILKVSQKKREQYRQTAIAQRKVELSRPKHLHEAKTFRAILENFSEELAKGNEKYRIATEVKTLAVQELFNDLKKKKTDIKTLFKK